MTKMPEQKEGMHTALRKLAEAAIEAEKKTDANIHDEAALTDWCEAHSQYVAALPAPKDFLSLLKENEELRKALEELIEAVRPIVAIDAPLHPTRLGIDLAALNRQYLLSIKAHARTALKDRT